MIALSILLRHINISDLLYGKQDVDLAVCILSARNNFNYRDAIRRSWLKDFEPHHKKKSAVAKFILGNMDCPIHPKDRLDPHECQAWEPKIPEKTTEITAFSMVAREDRVDCQIVQLFYVKVMHDVILRGLGVVEVFPFENLASNDSVQIVLYDSVTNDEITSVLFTQEQGIKSNGFLYKPVQELQLPKGYEFTLVVISPTHIKWKACESSPAAGDHTSLPTTGWTTKSTHHNLLLVEFLDTDDTLFANNNGVELLAAASLMFSLHDVPSLQRHISLSKQRALAWQEEIRTVASQLQDEEARHGDVVQVTLMDVYRNLPQKLLMCHAWLHESFNPRFVMKTDDDCFVNVAQVMDALPRDEPERVVWWGNFRKNWAVERHGKWREPTFSSSVYPKFACGSGYAVSNKIHSWFIQNRDLFHKFQGEDVSTGIWLSALDVAHIQDDRWYCGRTCHGDALSVPELTAGMVWWHWNNSKHCPSPCQPC
ncbi:hypothetical protein BsWGS_10378 [Bradybaena similaris]